MKLQKHEYIITAYAYAPCGPGWGNQLVVAVIGNAMTRKTREECFQPKQQTDEMATLLPIACIIHNRLTAEAAKLLKP